jgi:hypothetical protein
MSGEEVQRSYELFREHASEGRQRLAYQEFKKCPELVNLLIDGIEEEDGLSFYHTDIYLEVGPKEAEEFRGQLKQYGVDTKEFLELAKMGERLDSVEGQAAMIKAWGWGTQ